MESPKVQKVSHGLSKVVIFETENLRFAGFVELSSSTHESAGWVFFFRYPAPKCFHVSAVSVSATVKSKMVRKIPCFKE